MYQTKIQNLTWASDSFWLKSCIQYEYPHDEFIAKYAMMHSVFILSTSLSVLFLTTYILEVKNMYF